MSSRSKPSFVNVLQEAREATISRAPSPDDRSSFDVYRDLAWLIRCGELITPLSKSPISPERMAEVIDAEAYAIAQPAHLRDGGFYTEQLGLLLKKHAEISNK